MRFEFNEFVLDCEQRVLRREGNLVPLSPKVFETLTLLVQAAGRIVTKQEFMDALWPDSFVEDGNLTQNIFVLRRVLGSASDGRSYIETIPKRGYRFAGSAVHHESSASGLQVSQSSEVFVAPPGNHAAILAPKELAASHDADDQATPATRESRLTNYGHIAGFSLPLLLVFLLGGYLALHSVVHGQISGYQRLTNDGLSKDLRLTHSTIVQDNYRLFFNEAREDKAALAQVSITGGETTYELAPSPNSQAVGLDPHGGKLLFGSTWQAEELQPLVSKDLKTGAFMPVFNLHAHDAGWSPDGKRLAYAQFGKVYVRSSDGSTNLVASVGGMAYWLRWSPDGQVLRFTENYEGFHDRLWEVNSSGTNLHQLDAHKAGSESMCCGSWTRSGRAFVYMSNAFHASSIHIRLESEGSLWDRWTHGMRAPIEVPAAPLDSWEAAVPGEDGRHIYAIGEQQRGRLVRFDPVTRKPEPFLGGISAEGVSFSPDRAFIVWSAYPEGTLWRSRIDGSERIQLTQTPSIARFPHWSPDGSTIVFIAAQPGSDWRLYTVPARGGSIKPVLQQATGQGVATWSADSRTLAFGDLINIGETHTLPPRIEIYRLGDRQAITIPGSTGLWTARWSPDGRFISALTMDNRTLRLYDRDKGTWTDLAQGNINDVVWTLDSKYLFFDTAFGSKPVLYRVRISDRKLEAWASLDNFRRAGFFAPWLGVALDGAPILLEDTSIQEVYSIAVNLP